MDLTADDSDLHTFFAQEAAGESMSRQAYLRLRDQIVTLARAPGSPLPESILAQELGLGRTPVREALQWLACQGLVEIRPRLGAVVAPIQVTDLPQIFEVRQAIEGYSTALASERATPGQLEAMAGILARLADLAPEGDTRAHIALDRAFHMAVARAAHNRFVLATVQRLYLLNLRLWYLALERVGPMHSSLEQHWVVLAGLNARDAAAAGAAMRKHIGDFQDRIRAVLG
jgi:DNA-binding GntR family transcriptional regulator